MFKNLSQMASLMKNAQEIGGKVQQMNEDLAQRKVTASTGAGMVEVEANGLGQITRVAIEPSLVEKGEREMIEDLLPAAINQAVVKARKLQSEALQEMTGGMNLPGLTDAFNQFVGGAEDGPPDESKTT